MIQEGRFTPANVTASVCTRRPEGEVWELQRARASVMPWCTGNKEALGRGSRRAAHEGSPSKNGDTVT